MFDSHKNSCFEIFGFDFIVDQAFKVWIMYSRMMKNSSYKKSCINDCYVELAYLILQIYRFGYLRSIQTHVLKNQVNSYRK